MLTDDNRWRGGGSSVPQRGQAKKAYKRLIKKMTGLSDRQLIYQLEKNNLELWDVCDVEKLLQQYYVKKDL